MNMIIEFTYHKDDAKGRALHLAHYNGKLISKERFLDPKNPHTKEFEIEELHMFKSGLEAMFNISLKNLFNSVEYSWGVNSDD